MISGVIVWAAVAFTIVFVAAWAASPAWRDWIERPKHRFLEAVADHGRHADRRDPPAGTGTA